MLVSNIDYDDYVGRIAVGRIERGTFKLGMPVSICKEDKTIQGKIAKLYTHVGLKKEEVEEAKAGDIIELAGIADISIGDTICDLNNPEKIPFVNIDEPTVSMTFSVNNGPLAGREGEFVTSRHIRDRLFKELERNVSLRVKEGDTPDSFEVSGRGELHLSVLIETMRREGFELLVSRPKVIIKEIDGVKCEPIESLVVNVPDDSVGTVIEKLGNDFYVLPSSVHECLVVPADKKFDASDLTRMVREVNATEVLPEERLSNRVYRYTVSEGIKLA